MDLKPKMLLNTHCHLDHVGNKFIAEKIRTYTANSPDEKLALDFAPRERAVV